MSESKLRTIYEAIDNKNYKQALKLCNALSQKGSKQTQLVKSLKALSLERLGKTEEATEICKELKQEQPIDTTVLETLVIVLKGLGQLNDIVSLYENAYKLNPKNETMLLGVFNSYVRLNDFQNQNKTALSLWKQFNKEKYLIWSIVSIALQVESSGMVKLLDLAEKMMRDKLLNENKIKDIETMELYIGILEKQGKYEDALSLIENKFGEINEKVPELKYRSIVNLNKKLNNWLNVINNYKILIEKYNMDDWHYWTDYLISNLKYKETVDNQFDIHNNIISFIQFIQNKVNYTKRGPYLIELHYYLSINNNNNNKLIETNIDVITNLLLKYINYFGDKEVCYSDIKPYLHLFISTPKLNIINIYNLIKCNQEEDNNNSNSNNSNNKIEYYRRITTKYRIAIDWKIIENMEEKEFNEEINKINKYYEESKKVNDGKKEKTEYGCGDTLLNIIIHLLWTKAINYNNNNNNEKSKELIYSCLVLLENSLQYSSFNYQFKFQIMTIYNQIGNNNTSVDYFNSLDVKHILYDTILYLILDDTISMGNYSVCNSLFQNTIQFHDENTKQTPDYIIRCYVNSSYSRIQELIKFKSKLENSQQLLIVNVESILSGINSNSNSLLELEMYLRSNNNTITNNNNKINNNIDSIECNFDYKVTSFDLPWYFNHLKTICTSALTIPISSSNSNKNQFKHLKLRSLIPQLMLSLLLSNETDSTSIINNLNTIDLNNLFTDDLQLAQNELYNNKYWSFVINTFVVTNDWLVLSKQVDNVDFNDNLNNELYQSIKNNLIKVTTLQSELKNRIIESLDIYTNKTNLWCGNKISEVMMFINEAFTWFMLQIAMWYKYIPQQKKKKGSNNVIVNELRTIAKETASQARQTLQDLLHTISTIKSQNNIIAFDSSNTDIDLLKTEELKSITQETIKKINLSYTNFLNNAQKQMEKKLVFLKEYK